MELGPKAGPRPGPMLCAGEEGGTRTGLGARRDCLAAPQGEGALHRDRRRPARGRRAWPAACSWENWEGDRPLAGKVPTAGWPPRLLRDLGADGAATGNIYHR